MRQNGFSGLRKAVTFFCFKKTLPPWSAWKNGSTRTLKAAISAEASPQRLRTGWPTSTLSRSKTFWMTTPCFSTGAEGLFSGNTVRPKVGTGSSLLSTPKLAGQAFAAGRPGRKRSVKSVSGFWPKILGPIFHLCFACEVWQFFSGQKIFSLYPCLKGYNTHKRKSRPHGRQ